LPALRHDPVQDGEFVVEVPEQQGCSVEDRLAIKFVLGLFPQFLEPFDSSWP
jgi:hypothetical protein